MHKLTITCITQDRGICAWLLGIAVCLELERTWGMADSKVERLGNAGENVYECEKNRLFQCHA